MKPRWILIASVVVGAAGAWLAADILIKRVQAGRLPQPPPSGTLATPVAAQIAEADRAARGYGDVGSAA